MNATRPILVLTLLAACSDQMQRTPAVDTTSTVSTSVAAMDGFAPPISLAQPSVSAGKALGSMAARGRRMEESQSRPAPTPTPQQQTVASNMIIRNGTVSIEVDSVEKAIERVRQLATSLGGIVGGLTMNTGEHQVRSATMELKIPAARFDSAMTGMPVFGKVEYSNTSAVDVGEEFVDISARAANARRLEERLVHLLATRTGKLEDVLAVERELARVREEIERHEGRIRFLSARVATSTITATVHEKAPIIAARPGQNVLARAFINMWRNFVGVITAGIELLGVLLPIAAVLGLVFLVWRRWLRRVATVNAPRTTS